MSKNVSHNCVVNNGEHVTSRRCLLGQAMLATACGATGLAGLFVCHRHWFAKGRSSGCTRNAARSFANAAFTASSENIGSLEFGTHVLGAKVLYVLGHTECGAVNATMKGTDVPGQISGLFQYIRPAVKTPGGDLNKAIRENVRNQATLLAEASPVISKMIQRKELIVAGGIYGLGTGVVTAIDLSLGRRCSRIGPAAFLLEPGQDWR